MKEIKIRPRPRSSKVCSGVNEKRSQTGWRGDLGLNETEDPSQDREIRGKIRVVEKKESSF